MSRLLQRCCLSFSRVGLGLAALALCSLALAAPQSDWWFSVTNDKAAEVRILLARGVDPNHLSPKGQPAIMQAIRDGSWKVYDVLAARPDTDVNAMNVNHETPLMYLAIVGQTKRARALIRRGAEVNRLGWTPLQYAASKGQLDMVKLLIANKAIINAPAPDGSTALMMAAYAGNEAIVRLLLDSGADVTTRNLKGLDAADTARMKQHESLAKKIDALIDSTMAQRAQARTGVQPAGSAAAAPAQPAEKTRPAETSSSRYFDLDRFDKPDAGM